MTGLILIASILILPLYKTRKGEVSGLQYIGGILLDICISKIFIQNLLPLFIVSFIIDWIAMKYEEKGLDKAVTNPVVLLSTHLCNISAVGMFIKLVYPNILEKLWIN